MSDPYKVLNISPTASDDEVKHAYRELARKYHPDNYHDNPLADLAQEKMKEINEAYEQIQRQRKGGYAASSQRSGGYNGSYGNSYSSSTSGDPLLQRVRLAINSGDITQAERLLNEASDRGAEWSFLMGIVCSRRGWMDDARQYLETACRMEPNNEEYRQALQMFTSSGGYRPAGFRGFGTMTYGNDACMRLCAAWSCCMLSGGRCFFC
ncbi:MAG: DnaJ domain-containing protein [Oscillospiraceae bacterium]|nr:DnaJ domain-containing protein [Oscillospiraceae bacterium]